MFAAAFLAFALPVGADAAISSLFGFKKKPDEIRTLYLYMVHTKESLAVTYKRDGRYIPEAMKQINWILRDWRRDEATKMDPKTVDLMWELHADLGSQKPIHIISGFRSATTNGMLRRIGRKVARHSRHIRGQAIDLYFPDIPTKKLRNSALVRRVGGVGYYPRSGNSGFVHIDSGKVRHWPRVGPTQMANILRDYRSTIGARHNHSDQPTKLFAAFQSLPDVAGKPKGGPIRIGQVVAANQAVAGNKIPKPRPRPLAVMMLAAAKMKITPAAAPVPGNNFAQGSSLIRSNLAGNDDLTSLDPASHQRSNITAKGSFADAVRAGTAQGTQLIRPLDYMTASASGDGSSWWPTRLFTSFDGLFRRDGAPRSLSLNDDAIPVAHEAILPMNDVDAAALKEMIAALAPTNRINLTTSSVKQQATGKADRLEVNRKAKGNMVSLVPLSLGKRKIAQTP